MSTGQNLIEQSKRDGARACGNQIYWICRGVFIEAIRRREVSVVVLFMGLFVVGAMTARFVGAESQAAAAFILNLGLSLVWTMGVLLAILLAARQFPDELETRALYPLLAKPVARYQYVVGKWLATTLACAVTALVLNAIAVAASPWPKGLFPGMLAQAVLLEVVVLAMVAALAIALSIRLPKSLAMVITGLLTFGATPVISLIMSRFMPGEGRATAQWLTGYIPNVGRLDLFNAFSAGAPPTGWWELAARVLYGAVVVAFGLGIATALLERRSL